MLHADALSRGRGTNRAKRDPPTVPGSARPRRICSGSVALYHGQAGIPRAADSIGAAARRGVVCEAAALFKTKAAKPVNLHPQQERSRATLVRRLMCYDRVDTGARARAPLICRRCLEYVFLRKGQLNRHTRYRLWYRPATTTRNPEQTGAVTAVVSLDGLTHRRGFQGSGPPPPIHRHSPTNPVFPYRFTTPSPPFFPSVMRGEEVRARRKRNNLSDVSLVESWNLWVRVRCAWTISHADRIVDSVTGSHSVTLMIFAKGSVENRHTEYIICLRRTRPIRIRAPGAETVTGPWSMDGIGEIPGKGKHSEYGKFRKNSQFQSRPGRQVHA